MQVRPLGERVVVRLDPEGPLVSEGGIHMPGRLQSIRTATVLAVGPGCDIPAGGGASSEGTAPRSNTAGKTVRYTTQVKPGERVCFMNWVFHTKQGEQVRSLLDEDIGIVNERDILFVIEEGNPRIE